MENPDTKYQRKYRNSHPWAKHYSYSKSRCIKDGREHTVSITYLKTIWFRDKAFELKRPSIDRIDTKKGYIPGNCRFIELSENIRRSNISRVKTKKMREASAHNIRTFNLNNPPWNKGKSIEIVNKTKTI